MKTSTAIALLSLALTAGCTARDAGEPAVAGPEPLTSLVIAWNQELLAVAQAEDRFLTLKGVRAAAMMHAAVSDALNGIEPRFGQFVATDSQADADPIAAATEAAYGVAVDQYPDEADRFDAERAAWLDQSAGGRAEQLGRELGRTAATHILAERREDGWDAEATYRWHPMAPGVYAEFSQHSGTPEGFVFGAGWAIARPFMLDSPSHFRAGPPPAIESAAYARAFAEVKELGRFQSPSRTADQSHLALWWKDFVESSHNRLARQLVAAEGLEGRRAARLFALLNMTIYDAYVGVFDNKFAFNHWRPYTAIRWAAHDGNPETAADPEWDNTHRHTYAFPSYPSAHGTGCAAAMTVLEETFGSDFSFSMTTPEVDEAGPFSPKIAMDPDTRSFASFAAAAEECALSRIYLGIHFRYDSEAGIELGRTIGAYAVDNHLTAL